MKPKELYLAFFSISLESPFLFGGYDVQTFGLDASQERDYRGVPIIPASEITGQIRNAVELIAPEREIELFGQADGSVSGRGAIWFNDCVLEGEVAKMDTTRVAIDPKTGASKTGHLQTVELVRAPGDKATFRGSFFVLAGDEKEATEFVDVIRKSTGILRSIGRYKTAGFGRVLESEVEKPRETSFLAIPKKQAARDCVLSFGLDRALLVDTKRLSNNLLQGRSVIPGSVLKGALAEKLRLAGLDCSKGTVLGQLLSDTKIGHARPYLGERQLDQEFPLSLMSDPKGENWYDAAKDQEWSEATKNHELLSFGPDWKKYPKSETTQTYTRTRNQINRETGAAKESILFTQVMVSPVVSGKEIVWRSEIAFPEQTTQEEQEATEQISGALSTGLFGIGKTRAVMAKISVEDKHPETPSIGDVVRIVLTAPLMMLRAKDMKSSSSLQEAVEDYWKQVSGGALQLRSREGSPLYFADQEYVGGWPIQNMSPFGQSTVESFVLLKPGSVFCLLVKNKSDAERHLSKWLTVGLPLSAQNLGWESCPYLPENGYGAIELDPDLSTFRPENAA